MSDNTSPTPKYTRDQMIAKIQKLLNLAENNPNEAQAAAAAAKAQEWMTQWAIDEAALDAASGMQSDPFTVEKIPYHKGKAPERWEVALRQAIAEATMTHTFRLQSELHVAFAGRSKDVQIAAYMFVTLATVLRSLSRRRLSEHGAETKQRTGKSIYNVQQCRVLSGCHPTVYRQRWLDSWMSGAVAGVKAKLEEQRQQTAVEGSQALMVIENRSLEAEQYATKEFGLVPGRKLKARLAFANALEQGVKDGKAININKGITAGPNPHQLEG